MEKNNSSEQSHFLLAKEIVSTWPKWKQEIVSSSNNSSNQSDCSDTQK